LKNVYFIHLHQLYPSHSDLDVTQWLCRTCAAARHARAELQYAVDGSEVCEQCGARQLSFPINSYVERKRTARGTRTIAGRVCGVGRSGRLLIDWIEPNRIGGDGWRRDEIAFTNVKPASPERIASAERYAQQRGTR
jgi:hypothetical protein